MEHFFIFNKEITTTEFLSYFAFNIFYFLGIILNLILFVFFKRKIDTRRVSDFITESVFLIASLILAGIFIKNYMLFPQFNFTLFGTTLLFNTKITMLQFLINLFFVFFIFTTYKLTRKARFKTALINSIILFTAFISCLLVQIQNDILAYLLLDVMVFSIYKFASSMRIRKEGYYNVDFLSKTLCADILFFLFYITGLVLKDQIQLDIIRVCLTCSFLLKIGLFPVFNYSTSNHYKTNIPYSILIFCFLPLASFVAFEKLILNFGFTNETYQLSMAIFLSLLILCCALKAFKTKNLIVFLANISYCSTSFAIAALLFGSDFNCAFKLLLMSEMAIFGLYSLCAVLKINLKCEKITFSTFKGIFLHNRIFTLTFSILLLIVLNVLPAAILKYNIDALKSIYIFDKLSTFLIFFIILGNILILVNALKLIQYCYTIDKKCVYRTFYKKTAHNYALAYLVIIFLIAVLFL